MITNMQPTAVNTLRNIGTSFGNFLSEDGIADPIPFVKVRRFTQMSADEKIQESKHKNRNSA